MSYPDDAPSELDPVASALVQELAAFRESSPEMSRVVGRLLEGALYDPARDILARTGKGFRAQLVEHAWTIAGGRRGEMPQLLTVAIELLHVGSLVIDDIEDDSAFRRGEPALHRLYGVPLALNTGNWLYFFATSCISRLPVDDACKLAASADVTTTLMRCHQGQALDISVAVTSLSRTDVAEVVLKTTELKTGSLIGLATALGARCAGASDETVEQLRAFGEQVGIGLQMLDDWSGIHNERRQGKGIEDLQLARPTWPWAWLAEHGDQVSYADVLRSARESSIEWELARVRQRIGTRLAAVVPGLIDAQLDQAMSILFSATSDAAVLSEVEADLKALVAAYA